MGRLDKKIRSAARRRVKQGRPASQQQVKLTVTSGERDRFTNRYAHVLFDIEKELVAAASTDSEIDDAVVEAALRTSIRSETSESPPVQRLVTRLDQAREACYADADVWLTGLRVIYDSVTTRSKCVRGETSYLRYALQFLRRATRPF